MTALVVCQDADADAVSLAGRLAALGPQRLELVLASQLVHGARWEHRVGTWGSRTRLRLADGRDIDSPEVGGVLNRLWWVTAEGFTGASDVDREYAGSELYALAQSWLQGFGARVINRPKGLGLSGPWRTTEQWRALAGEHGLAIRAFPEKSEQPTSLAQVLLLDGEVVDGEGAPDAVREGALRLAAGLDHDLLELHFDQAWRFADATLMPVLSDSPLRTQSVARALKARRS